MRVVGRVAAASSVLYRSIGDEALCADEAEAGRPPLERCGEGGRWTNDTFKPSFDSSTRGTG